MPKIRVLVVDDAVVMRKLISEALSRDPEIEVVGTAANGHIGLQKITQVNPDIITLDVEMPDMDGLQMLRELRKTYPKLPVIMFSTLTSRAAASTLQALGEGATDYVTKPANVGNVSESIQKLNEEMVPKIKLHCGCTNHRSLLAETKPRVPVNNSPSAVDRAIEILCVGTSTGGPNALAEFFNTIPANFPVPIVIVQHMPPLFTAMLAQRLEAHAKLRFHEGMEGQAVESGHVYIAPGGKHMEVIKQGAKVVLHLTEEPPENSCRPAVDVLFRSVVKAYQTHVLGVVMTGMGQDGLRGCELIKENHGQVLVQDEASSVVWGMPGYVAHAGLADRILPLDQLAGEVVRRVEKSRALVPNNFNSKVSNGHLQVRL